MFAKRLEFIKGRKQFDTAPHFKFGKLQRFISVNFKGVFLGLWPTSGLSRGFQILF